LIKIELLRKNRTAVLLLFGMLLGVAR